MFRELEALSVSLSELGETSEFLLGRHSCWAPKIFIFEGPPDRKALGSFIRFKSSLYIQQTNIRKSIDNVLRRPAVVEGSGRR